MDTKQVMRELLEICKMESAITDSLLKQIQLIDKKVDLLEELVANLVAKVSQK